MMRRLVLFAVIVLAAMAEASLLSVLPAPLSQVRLTLIIAVALLTGFRFGEYAVAALLGGAILDALSPEPIGTHLLAMAGTALLVYLLFTRVLTNVSWPSFVGINSAAFLSYYVLLAVIRAVEDAFDARTFFFLPTAASMGLFLVALAIQIGVAAVTASSFRRAKAVLRSSFLILR